MRRRQKTVLPRASTSSLPPASSTMRFPTCRPHAHGGLLTPTRPATGLLPEQQARRDHPRRCRGNRRSNAVSSGARLSIRPAERLAAAPARSSRRKVANWTSSSTVAGSGSIAVVGATWSRTAVCRCVLEGTKGCGWRRSICSNPPTGCALTPSSPPMRSVSFVHAGDGGHHERDPGRTARTECRRAPPVSAQGSDHRR